MRRYVLISGLVFTLLTLGQLIRFLMKWPVVIANVAIPAWCSLIAALIFGALAVSAFRSRPA